MNSKSDAVRGTSGRSWWVRDPRVRASVALALAGALGLTACGGDDADTASSEGSGGGEEITLRFSALFQPGSAIQDALDAYTNAVTEATDGQVVFETSYGGSLLKATDTLTGVQTGRADAAYLAPAYAPADLPLWNLAMQPGIVENAEAEARTLEWMGENNEYFQKEQEENGIKVLGYLAIGPLDTAATKEPVTSVDDLDGLTLRALGPISQALAEVGVNPVAIEAQEAYESIQRGVIDGTTGLPLDLMPGQGIHEVAPWVTHLNYGTYGSGSFIMSLDTWNDLPADIQDTMVEVAEDFTAKSVEFLEKVEAGACDTMIAAGGGVTVLPEAEVDAWKSQVGDKLLESWRKTAQDGGASQEAIDSVLSDFTEKNEEFAETARYTSGLAQCAEKTTVPTS